MIFIVSANLFVLLYGVVFLGLGEVKNAEKNLHSKNCLFGKNCSQSV
jgi:hypothetical protein